MIRIRFLFCFLLTLVAADAAAGQCSAINLVGPAGVTAVGSKMLFRLEGSPSGVSYSWVVSAGAIVDGQGTATISVATDKTMSGANVTATVDISGLPTECQRTRSVTAPVAPKLEWESIDEWGIMKPDDARSRLDPFLIELENYPSNTGLIVLHVPENERRDARNQRVRFVISHLRFRKFDLKRIWFSLVPGKQVRTVLYRFYPGAESDIPCDRCVIIKGGDVE